MGGEVLFQAGNKGGLPFSGCMKVFMFVMFSIPIFAIPTTFPLLPEHPILIPLVWLLFCFPVAVLIVLGRLMGRYALAVRRDGIVEIVYPFRTLRLGPADFSRVVVQSAHLGYAQGMPIRRPDVKFARHDDSIAASVAMNAFSAQQWQDFLAALRSARPDVRID